ncbi:cell wall metabolism sensor histidine kinase WalK [Streptomyces sp. AC495_CC817]|uniref:sensor histidine kinase n=1 Tax=Streptomyces sp. AC495_CC817 TaxID=2823900 RepID=UPI001C27542D|nr:HAMP domain-containing sensor histidine kinase [Streptomyces sp. AC495_CC817]
MVRTLSIWRWQLIFTGSVAAMVVVIAAFRPSALALPTVIASLGLVVATSIATLVVPWNRLPRWAAVGVPLLDALAIGLASSVTDIRLGFLWVFPVTWIATYFALAWVFGCIGLISVCLIVFADHTGAPADTMVRMLSVVLTLGFLGTTVHLGARRARAVRHLLRRQSEQASRAAERAETQQLRVTQVIDALDVALVVVARDGRIRKTNDAYRGLYGLDAFGAALPSTAVEYDSRRGEPLPPERTSVARGARGEELVDERVWLYDSEGRWHALDVSTQVMAADTPDEHLTLVIIVDVTDPLEAEERRRTLSAVVSHEIRNPLTAMIGHVDLLLERDDLPERVVSQLEVVASAGERLQNLVAGALGDLGAEPEAPVAAVDLRQIAEASAASYSAIAWGSGQELTVEGEASLTIDGDAFRLRQVLDNLLSNAVKYTPAGGRITVSVSADPGDGRPGLTITDTGDGVGQDELDRLFEPYFRSDAAVRAGIPGTGLGMGIARDIVSAHDGTIDVASAPGRGTTVTLRFPHPRTREDAG